MTVTVIIFVNTSAKVGSGHAFMLSVMSVCLSVYDDCKSSGRILMTLWRWDVTSTSWMDVDGEPDHNTITGIFNETFATAGHRQLQEFSTSAALADVCAVSGCFWFHIFSYHLVIVNGKLFQLLWYFSYSFR